MLLRKMKLLSILVALSIAVGIVQIASIPAFADNTIQTWNGWLIDTDCVGTNPKTHTQNCNLMPTCIASGEGIYVYTAGKTSYGAADWIPFDAASQGLANQLNQVLSDPSNHEAYLSKYPNRIPTIQVTGYLVNSGLPSGLSDYGDWTTAIHITSIQFYYISGVSNYEVTSPENVVLAETPATPTATVPGAPTGVSAAAGDSQAAVSFTAPASNGGSAITGYKVQAYVYGQLQSTTTGTTSPITVAGLTNGTVYTFTVKAVNSAGDSAESTASAAVSPVAIVAVPGTPTNVSAAAGDSQAVVSFAAPASDGGSAITGYKVQTYANGVLQPNVATGTVSPITVTGLTNGTSYTFTVKATNLVGDSAVSAASSAVTPSEVAVVPGVPTSAVASAGNAQAIVSFTAPASNGGSAITGYKVQTYANGVLQTIVTIGTASPITVKGLTNGTSYTFTVKAVNTVGESAESAASSAVTPSAPAVANAGTNLTSDADPVYVSNLFTVSYTLSNIAGIPSIAANNGISALDVTIKYDSKIFQFKDVIPSTGLLIADKNTDTEGVLRLLIVSEGDTNSIKADKEILKVTFTSKAFSKLSKVGIDSITVADSTGLEYIGDSKQFTLISLIKAGDLNGDSKITIGDLAIVAKNYGRTSTNYQDWDSIRIADTPVKDNKVDISDLAFVAQKVLGK